ncbi:MAG: hypothetical protein ACKVQJ_02235 [Pyrinomonadaceae bacterium]
MNTLYYGDNWVRDDHRGFAVKAMRQAVIGAAFFHNGCNRHG